MIASLRRFTDRVPWPMLRNLFGVILLINLGSKAIGFVREVVISQAFGVSDATNTYFSLQQIPMAVGSFAVGAFGLAFIPYYAGNLMIGRGRQIAAKSTLAALVAGGVLAGGMALGGASFIPRMLGVSSPLSRQFSYILALSIPPSILVGLAFAVLVAHRRNTAALVVTAVSPALMLLCLIIQLRLAPGSSLALPVSYAVGFALAGVLALAVLVKAIRVGEKPPSGDPGAKTSDLGVFLRQLGASTVENVSANANQMLNIYFANAIGPRNVAINTFAMRIGMLALTGIISPFNQVIQGRLARSKPSEVRSRFMNIFAAFVAGVFLIAAATVLLRYPLVRLVYQRGKFTPMDTIDVASVIVPWGAYLFVMSVNQLLARYYFVVAQGTFYTACLVSAYVLANLLKIEMSRLWGLTGIIWACVCGEGLAGLVLSARVLLDGGRARAK